MKIASRGARVGMPAALFLLVAFGGNAAIAQSETQRVAENPPLLQLKRKPAQALLQAAPPGTRAPQSREASLDLNVVYTSGQLWNPAERKFDSVKLRSYQGASINPDTPFISPMLDIKPGDTIRVALNNKLPADPTCTLRAAT